jgi:catechol 2,3-dioxygenase-like lactoylglutathione lyase family enzyme
LWRPVGRLHDAARTRARVDRFGQAGGDAGFADVGPAALRPDYADNYSAALLKDRDGNTFDAVHRDGDRPTGCIDHVAIRVNDLEASTVFYSTIAEAIGLMICRRTADTATVSLEESEGSLIVIAGEPSHNAHIAFSGNDEEVRRFHANATAAGYRSNGEPGERPRYHDGYYAAYVLDPNGNNIEVVNHEHRRAT